MPATYKQLPQIPFAVTTAAPCGWIVARYGVAPPPPSSFATASFDRCVWPRLSEVQTPRRFGRNALIRALALPIDSRWLECWRWELDSARSIFAFDIEAVESTMRMLLRRHWLLAATLRSSAGPLYVEQPSPTEVVRSGGTIVALLGRQVRRGPPNTVCSRRAQALW